MRFKVLPEPRPLSFVEAAQRSVPRVPRPESDCVARLRDETDLRSRDQARAWLSVLRALGLVARTDAGFHRTGVRPDPERLARAFRENVYGAAEALDTLRGADGPLTADAVAARLDMPPWERDRRADPERAWRARTDRLLGWLVALELVDRADGGYSIARR